MENLHEIGFVVREKRRRIRNRALLAVVLTVLLGGLMLAGARIDGLERQVAQAQAQAQAQARTDTVILGLKRATLQDGDVVLRIGIVGETGRTSTDYTDSTDGSGRTKATGGKR